MTSASTCDLAITQLPSEFPTTGHVIPGFQENLVGVGPICYANCTVTFTKHTVHIYIPTCTPIITCWREKTGPCLWRMSIIPNPVNMPPLQNDHKTTTLQYFSVYDIISMEVLIQYFHVDAGFPVRYNWLKYVKAENSALWTGLTYQNAAKSCPTTDKTLKGHMVQVRQGLRSTKPNPTKTK